VNLHTGRPNKRLEKIKGYLPVSHTAPRAAGLGTLWISMATVAGCRVDPAIDGMAGKIVPAVRHSAIIISLVLDRGFQLDPYPVTVTAKTSPVAGTANIAVLGGHHTMVVGKIH